MHLIDNSASATRLRRRNRFVRSLASIRFGLTIMVLILVYASIGSALAPVRGALELTEMQVFQHWVFLLLIGLFVASLITATVTRIRWTLINTGVLTVHSGLLLLIGGAAWYFWSKVEGDVLLVSPRVEIHRAGGGQLPGGEFLADVGQSWERTMPAFGGRVRFEATDVRARDLLPVATVTVLATVGDQPATRIELSANAVQSTPVGNGLALRLRAFPGQTRFYDHEAAALYYARAGSDAPTWVELPGLPLHRERYLPDAGVLRDSAGRAVPSKRTSPALTIGPLTVPTGWLEPWRLPIRPETPELPFDVEVTGYVPYIAGLESTLAAGNPTENPLLALRLDTGRDTLEQVLAAFDPLQSLWDLSIPFEFAWVRDPAELEAALQPQAGPHELSIEVIDPPLKRVVAIAPQQVIELEGTSYRLTVEGMQPSWTLVSPGFEGARSAVAVIRVQSAELEYQRTVVERFPQLSQDIDEHGKRHNEGPYDANLVLRYRSSPDRRVLILAGPDLPPLAAVFDTDGSVQRYALAQDQAQPLRFGSALVNCTLLGLERYGRRELRPQIEPIATRRPNLGRQPSAIRLRLTGRGTLAGWSESHWLPFSHYPGFDARSAPGGLIAPPLTVRPPDGSAWQLAYSRVPHELGTTLVPGKLSVKLFPGGRSAESWRSDFFVVPPAPRNGANAGAALRPAVVQTNDTFTVGPWTLFQSGAAGDHWGWTILGVGNRRGIWPMATGCVLIVLGCLFAFYVKPVLRQRAVAARAAPVPAPAEEPRAGAVADRSEPEEELAGIA